MQPHGTRPPLFLFPGAHRDVLGYASLPRLLSPDQPVYGLRSVGVDGDREPFENMAEIVDGFVKDIRLRQPRGPYHLIGFCLAGITAFEVAQRLRADGEEVCSLTLIEVWPTGYMKLPWKVPELVWQLRYLARSTPKHLRALFSMPARQGLH